MLDRVPEVSLKPAVGLCSIRVNQIITLIMWPSAQEELFKSLHLTQAIFQQNTTEKSGGL